ncbi:hypothetical protein Tco_1267694 [Tanacetum coccineum]
MLRALREILLHVKQGLLNVIIVRVKGIWQRSALSLRGQGILHDPRVADVQATQTTIPLNAALQTDDLDANDSNCDDISLAKVVLMANLSSYDSDILSQMCEQMYNHVTNWDKVNQETKNVNESLTAELERYKTRVKTFKQRLNIDLSSREKLIDS